MHADHTHPDAVAVLPTGSTVPTFADRCRVVRAESYKRQAERNARFEHLRKLLCKPEPPAECEDEELDYRLVYLRNDVSEALWAESRSPRCTCCAEHRSPVFRYDDYPEERVYTYLENGWALRDCQACIRNHYADADARHGIVTRHLCKATLHRWSVEEPDSSTVKTDEEREAECAAAYEDAWCFGVERPEPYEPVHDPRPVGRITVNCKTGWVTYTSSQAKARVTHNATSGRVKLTYGQLELHTRKLDAGEDGVAVRGAWVKRAEEWLEAHGHEPNVCLAVSKRYESPVDAARRMRDKLSRAGEHVSVRIIR